MIEAIWVHKNQLDKVWLTVEPLLKSAIMKWLPVWDTQDFYAQIMDDTKQLWIAVDNEKESVCGAVVTEVVQYPKAKVVNVVLLGGNNIREWKDIMGEKIEEFSNNEDCYALQSMGRKGWQALFPDMFTSAEILTKILK